MKKKNEKNERKLIKIKNQRQERKKIIKMLKGFVTSIIRTKRN